MKIQDFDFPLPENLIALRPMEQRDHSRLLVLRRDGSMEHTKFAALHEYLNPGDMLLLNKTKVLPMRLLGRKPGGGVLEMLLDHEQGEVLRTPRNIPASSRRNHER
jgi:S-adenosylmethionine:tRNA ribosyltransferase-isomerase